MKQFKLSLAYFLCVTVYSFAPAIAADSKPTTIAFTFSMPPYLNADNTGGIELDLIQSALSTVGYQNIKILNVHYKRAIELTKQGKVDAIVSNQSNTTYSKHIPNIITSDKTLDYVDCAITLRKREISLNSINDYYDKSIWAFKSASEVLGSDFNAMTRENKSYTENFDQLKQVDMLAMERIDVAISDRNIFSAKLKSNKKYESPQFEFHSISPTTPRVIRSLNQALIDKFNQGLVLIRKNGQYDQIIERYHSSYANSCSD